MTDYTPPTGGHLLHTSEPNPGDRIAAAMAVLERTPPPGWLWALWVSCLPGLRRDPLAGPVPPDVDVIAVGEGEGFDTTPPHYGIVNREDMPAVAADDAKGPEYHARVLVRMLATGSAEVPRCVCGMCVPTGLPPGLYGYLGDEAFYFEELPHRATDADPYGHMRHTVALEVASARVQRDLYIYALRSGATPAGWLEQAEDMAGYPGHYLARMSDTGMAVGMCCMLWAEPMLEAGGPYLMPVEVVAGLAEGFVYPVPVPGSSEWEAQAKREGVSDAFPYCSLLAEEGRRMAESIADGVIPWEGPAAGEVAA